MNPEKARDIIEAEWLARSAGLTPEQDEAYKIAVELLGRVGDSEILTTVSREDIYSLLDSDDRPLFDRDQLIAQPVLAKIAQAMSEHYVESGAYWDALEDVAESCGLIKAKY